MRSECGLIAALLVAAASPAAATEAPRVLERILAVVDGRPLLLSEVQLVERLQGLAREPALERAIDERLMFEQAVRLPQTAPSSEESERAYAGLLARLAPAGPGDEQVLRELARRQATILKYVDFRFRPLARAERARDAAPAAEPEPVANPADLDRRIEEWVAELRDEAQIRYNPAEPGGS